MIGAAPAIDTLGPLTLSQRYDGPWLAIPADQPAVIGSIVLAGNPRAPTQWRRLDADQPFAQGDLATAYLSPLSDFGVCCTLYPHSCVLSVWVSGISRARHWDQQTGWRRAWEGVRCDRIRIERGMVELVRAAAKECNTLGRARA